MTHLLRICLLFGLMPFTVSAAELALDKNSFFDANFTIDSTYTSDGQNYQVSASGEAGPYGRVYLSYEFTDKQDLGDRGEYTGHAWTQNGEVVATQSGRNLQCRSSGDVFIFSFTIVVPFCIVIISIMRVRQLCLLPALEF